jgi:hypothetical protein
VLFLFPKVQLITYVVMLAFSFWLLAFSFWPTANSKKYFHNPVGR